MGDPMSADDALLFIDANKFLDLYQTDKGTKVLAPLGEQVDYIFVTQQVVSEVQRNKVRISIEHLADKFKVLKLLGFAMPDHLSGTEADQGKAILGNMGKISEQIKAVNIAVDALARGLVEQVSRSEDEVSKALEPIFSRMHRHSSEELQRARDRRELGNPPGKSTNAIGDQLTWEQILTHFKGKKRLWVISRDGDYGTFHNEKGYLNRFLCDELCAVSPGAQAFLFKDTIEGIDHFVKNTGVKADSRLTAEEKQEIKKEERSLPLIAHRDDDLLRTLAEFSRPNDEFRRRVAEYAKPGDAIRQMAESTAKWNEDLRQLFAQHTQPGDAIREMMDQTAKSHEEMRQMFIQPGDAIRQMVESTAKWNEDLRQVFAKHAQPGDAIREMMDQTAKSHEEMRKMFVLPGEAIRQMVESTAKWNNDLRHVFAQLPNTFTPKGK